MMEVDAFDPFGIASTATATAPPAADPPARTTADVFGSAVEDVDVWGDGHDSFGGDKEWEACDDNDDDSDDSDDEDDYSATEASSASDSDSDDDDAEEEEQERSASRRGRGHHRHRSDGTRGTSNREGRRTHSSSRRSTRSGSRNNHDDRDRDSSTRRRAERSSRSKSNQRHAHRDDKHDHHDHDDENNDAGRSRRRRSKSSGRTKHGATESGSRRRSSSRRRRTKSDRSHRDDDDGGVAANGGSSSNNKHSSRSPKVAARKSLNTFLTTEDDVAFQDGGKDDPFNIGSAATEDTASISTPTSEYSGNHRHMSLKEIMGAADSLTSPTQQHQQQSDIRSVGSRSQGQDRSSLRRKQRSPNPTTPKPRVSEVRSSPRMRSRQRKSLTDDSLPASYTTRSNRPARFNSLGTRIGSKNIAGTSPLVRRRDGTLAKLLPRQAEEQTRKSQNRRAAVRDSLFKSLGDIGGDGDGGGADDDDADGPLSLSSFIRKESDHAPKGRGANRSVASAPAGINTGRRPPRSSHRRNHRRTTSDTRSKQGSVNSRSSDAPRTPTAGRGTSTPSQERRKISARDLAESLGEDGYIEVVDGKMRLVFDVET